MILPHRLPFYGRMMWLIYFIYSVTDKICCSGCIPDLQKNAFILFCKETVLSGIDIFRIGSFHFYLLNMDIFNLGLLLLLYSLPFYIISIVIYFLSSLTLNLYTFHYSYSHSTIVTLFFV